MILGEGVEEFLDRIITLLDYLTKCSPLFSLHDAVISGSNLKQGSFEPPKLHYYLKIFFRGAFAVIEGLDYVLHKVDRRDKVSG